MRLLQVSYPKLLEQLIRMKPPREIAGREVKRRYARELGLPPDRIAAIYIAACQAKTVSIDQPAEGGRSSLDGAIGIPQIYNACWPPRARRRSTATRRARTSRSGRPAW